MFSGQAFTLAVGLTEPPMEIILHRRFLVNRLWKDPFQLAPRTGGFEKCLHKSVINSLHRAPMY